MCRQEPRQTGSGKTQPKELHSVSGWICSPVAKHRPLPAAQGTEASGSAPGACGWTHPKGAGQGGLAYCSPWGRKKSDTTERLTELN